ncbi:1-aminocyclopropane-1-carboxylate oxidase 5-like [Solanum stenotomum]|uniref:1-aminocyclopropane-1-carboxylate oxidase 5-like n=1 Tax=Solanum stenotomum TaxID=172797 RepID=UPI0020D00291|nr:1-aminocyclopropane-1-carboxylate oxidase 5-like [Solanum stenotomum]
MVEVHPAIIQDVEHRPKLTKTEAEGIPVIDISILNCPYTSTDAELESLVAEIRNACKKWGFFQVINHGVSLECREKIELASRQFFGLPKEEKIKVKRNEVNFIGYYDTELTKKIRDWKEVFDFTVEKTAMVPLSQVPNHKDLREFHNQWPQYPPGLREVCEEYIQEMQKLAYKLAEVISLSLCLPAKRLNEFFEDQVVFGRINHYPPCPVPHLALGVGRHKDAGLFTILSQDDTGGLEIKRKTDGEWIGVKPTPDAYIVNLGDATQVYSNGEYESVEHRVVLNTERSRFSIPFFVNPSHSTWIQPLEEKVNEKNPAKYKAYNWGMLYTHRRKHDPKTCDEENLPVDHFKA